MKRQAGFSLIELMIVVAIVGILAAISLPQFLRFSWKSKRAEAYTLLSAIKTAQNAYFASFDHFAYATGSWQDTTRDLGLLDQMATRKFYTADPYFSRNQNCGVPSAPSAPQDYVWYVSGSIEDDGVDQDIVGIKQNHACPPFTTLEDGRPQIIYDDILNITYL